MPDLPLDALLLSRLLLHVGREFASMLEQQIRPFGLAEAEFWVLVTLFSQPEASRTRVTCAPGHAKGQRTCLALAMPC